MILADDRALCREGIRHVLTGEPDIEIVAEVTDADQLLELLPEQYADVVLVSVSLPGPSLSELLRRIRKRLRAPRILLLGASAGHDGVGEALSAGAAGALARDDSPQLLAEAIRRVADRGRYVSRTLTRRSAPPVQGLSEREFEVLRLFGTGRNGREIAEELGISPKTVSTYRARIMKKLGLRTLPQLVRYALERGLAY